MSDHPARPPVMGAVDPAHARMCVGNFDLMNGNGARQALIRYFEEYRGPAPDAEWMADHLLVWLAIDGFLVTVTPVSPVAEPAAALKEPTALELGAAARRKVVTIDRQDPDGW